MDQFKELDNKVKLVLPTGYPKWDVQQKIDGEFEPHFGVKEQRRIHYKKTTGTLRQLSFFQKEIRYDAKLMKEEARRIKC